MFKVKKKPMSKKKSAVVEKARRESGDFIALQALDNARRQAYRRGYRRKQATSTTARVRKELLDGHRKLGDEIVTPNPTISADDVASGPRPSWRDPHYLREILTAFVQDNGWKSNVGVGDLMARWPVIVGPTVAQHCPIEAFDDGVLTLRASSSSWQTQITTLLATVQAKIDSELGEGIVSEIKVLSPHTRSFKRGRLSVKGRGVRDTYD